MTFDEVLAQVLDLLQRQGRVLPGAEAPLLKGLAQPLEVYQVLSESTARSRLEAAGSTGLTPLVGREQGC